MDEDFRTYTAEQNLARLAQFAQPYLHGEPMIGQPEIANIGLRNSQHVVAASPARAVAIKVKFKPLIRKGRLEAEGPVIEFSPATVVSWYKEGKDLGGGLVEGLILGGPQPGTHIRHLIVHTHDRAYKFLGGDSVLIPYLSTVMPQASEVTQITEGFKGFFRRFR